MLKLQTSIKRRVRDKNLSTYTRSSFIWKLDKVQSIFQGGGHKFLEELITLLMLYFLILIFLQPKAVGF